MTDVVQQMAELLLKSQLGELEPKIKQQIEEVNTSFEAKLDGLKVSLQSKINELETLAEEKPLQITIGTVENPKSKLVHKSFFKVINILKSQKRIQKNIMLVGEAGSGKTHLANNVAEVLNLKFYPMSVGLQTTKSDLLGFINAHGEYVTSPVREAFEKGGVLLLDEFDSTHAGVVTIINSLLANGHCSFPDKIVEKHKDFICIVVCNTYGHGANIDYVGRNRLDGATLDRFIVVDVGYDKNLEKKLTNNNDWIEIINKIRENIRKQGIKMIVSPRASMNGADLLEAGFPIKEVVNMCILKGADKDTITKCLNGINLETKKEGEKEEKKMSYKRDLEKYQTFVIKTEDKSLNRLTYLQPLNDIARMSTRYDYPEQGIRLMFGSDWVPEFSSKTSIYFSSNCSMRDIGYTISANTYQEDLLKEIFAIVETNNLKARDLENAENDVPVAFEFIAKGCRTPFKVITMEVENA